MYVSIEELRKQCNVDFEEDDRMIEKYGAAAERFIERRLNTTYDQIIEENNGVFPEDLEIAILMLAAHWYRVREAVSTVSQSRVPYGIEAQITPFKKMI